MGPSIRDTALAVTSACTALAAYSSQPSHHKYSAESASQSIQGRLVDFYEIESQAAQMRGFV